MKNIIYTVSCIFFSYQICAMEKEIQNPNSIYQGWELVDVEDYPAQEIQNYYEKNLDIKAQAMVNTALTLAVDASVGLRTTAQEIQNYYEENNLDIKAQAMANTALTLVGGAAIGLGTIGVILVADKMNRVVNSFGQAAELGSMIVGGIYGQGVALDAAYEREKDLLIKKQGQ